MSPAIASATATHGAQWGPPAPAMAWACCRWERVRGRVLRDWPSSRESLGTNGNRRELSRAVCTNTPRRLWAKWCSCAADAGHEQVPSHSNGNWEKCVTFSSHSVAFPTQVLCHPASADPQHSGYSKYTVFPGNPWSGIRDCSTDRKQPTLTTLAAFASSMASAVPAAASAAPADDAAAPVKKNHDKYRRPKV